MAKPIVSLVKVKNVYNSLKESDLPFPPFGVATKSVVTESLVRILVENGFVNITIGEGSLLAPGQKGDDIFRSLVMTN